MITPRHARELTVQGLNGTTRVASVLLASMFLLVCSTARSELAMNAQQQNPSAAVQTSQFGRLVGDWAIRDFARGPDGEFVEQAGADWHFFWILGGTAIQDNWISPGLNTPAPEKGRQYGTNIRIFNPSLNLWEMAWISNTGKKLETFEATADGKSLVMNGDYNGAETRITFYDISDDRFSWKMEQHDSESNQWSEVYLIEGQRMEKQP